MTIAVRITNLEPFDDETKELFVETLRPDGSVLYVQTLRGQQTETLHVHPNQSFRFSERFTDKLKR